MTMGSTRFDGYNVATIGAGPTGLFAATGITDGPLLEGIHYDRQGGVTTHSIVIRALSGLMRYLKGIHQLKRQFPFSRVDVAGAVNLASH